MSDPSPELVSLTDFIEALTDLNNLPVEVSSPFIFEDPASKVLEYRPALPGEPAYGGEYSMAIEAVLDFGQGFFYPCDDFEDEPDRSQLVPLIAAFKRACKFPIRWDFSDGNKGVVVYLDHARVLLSDQSIEEFDLIMGCGGMGGW